jgi:hypothetical protein
MLRAYLEESRTPRDGTRSFAPGRWVGEAVYPSPNIKPLALHLRADRSLGERPDAAAPCSRSARRRATARPPGNGWPPAVRASTRPISGSTTAARWYSTRRCSSTRSRCSARRCCDFAASPPTRRSRNWRCACRMWRRTGGSRASATRSSISRTATVTSTPQRLEPGRFYDVSVTLQRLRPPLPGGSPHPAVDRERLLADRLAGALPGDAEYWHGRQRARAAGSPGRTRTARGPATAGTRSADSDHAA